MNAFGREVVPTRSVLLELKDEAGFVREGLEFLDQQRTLLAAEILSWLRRFEELEEKFKLAHAEAVVALAEAAARHGPEELAVLPVEGLAADAVNETNLVFLGIPLVGARLAHHAPDAPLPVNPSPEARKCALRFQRLVELGVELAALSSNLHRLMHKYRWTERRALALEHVIVPELETAVHDISEALEEVDQEDAVRVRLMRR